MPYGITGLERVKAFSDILPLNAVRFLPISSSILYISP